ncbi:MAG: response regulator, partial [Chloroflexi bacterium]|nr:response regulator [Chloroflexota bacterium]
MQSPRLSAQPRSGDGNAPMRAGGSKNHCPVSHHSRGTAMKILVVDDQRANLKRLGGLLKRDGHDVVLATNGAEALGKAYADGCEAIISDVLMPGMDGFELCRNIKRDEKLKSIPFIFYTPTYTDEHDEEIARMLGADGFIRSPIEPQGFLAAVRDITSRARKGTGGGRRPVPKCHDEEFDRFSKSLVRRLEEKAMELEAEIAVRRVAEEQAIEALGKFESVIECTPQVAIQGFDRNGVIRHWNAASERVYGFPAHKAIGQRVQDLVLSAEDAAEFEETLARVWREGQGIPPREWQ